MLPNNNLNRFMFNDPVFRKNEHEKENLVSPVVLINECRKTSAILRFPAQLPLQWLCELKNGWNYLFRKHSVEIQQDSTPFLVEI